MMKDRSRQLTAHEVAAMSSGAMVGLPWRQDEFYFYLDAFLSAGRSVPDVIQASFG
ncbi:MAG TPA: hypothetical protein VE932_12015 [Patescibacteria group bacterium]|nr:hypothetical protein [Patescibacteria group bacterium]